MSSSWASPDAAPGDAGPHSPFGSTAPRPERPRPDRRALALLLAALLVLTGGVVALARDAGEDPPPDPRAINAVVPELRAFVERERGLTFTEDVEVELLDDDEFRERLHGTDDEDDEGVAGDEATLKALGLIEPDVDLAADLEKLTGSAVVGFYDTETNELVVRGGALTPAVKVTLVHELVHALQDQRLDIDRFDEPEFADREDEAPLGALALIEGDADHVESEYYETLSDDEQREVDEEQAGIGGDLDDIAPVLPVLLSFPYQVGPELVKTLLAAGGQERLDAAYKTPPVSTEQLLDVEKYLRNEQPLSVPPPKADGTVVDEGTLGQLGLTLMLLRTDAHADALAAADGWGGDSYMTWRDGDESCTRLAIRGDTPSDSTEINEALQKWAGDGTEITLAGQVTTVTSCH